MSNWPTQLIRDKCDVERAEAFVRMGYPAVEPALPHLVEWTMDGNWPVARVVGPFLASIGAPVVPALSEVLKGDDDTWKYFCITGVVSLMAPEVVAMLGPELQRLAHAPTPNEQREGVPEAARDVLAECRPCSTVARGA